jgi:hypothetical protein
MYLSEEFNGRHNRRGRYTGDILKNIPGTWDEEIILDSEGILWCHSQGQPDVYCEIIPLTEMAAAPQ